jgi:Fe-Mn family superoxide dismutase
VAFKLPDLPFKQDALEPHISSRTMSYHYGKHHQGYVDKLNKAVDGTRWESKSLEEIIVANAGNDGDSNLFNNAAQIWNHSFFWNSMAPDGGGKADGGVAKLIDESFGGADKFKKKFVEAAAGQFGSGWAWLVVKDGQLDVVTTSDAMTPLAKGVHPLACCDTWEHAYYLDYQNDKKSFFEAFCDHLINWDFVQDNLDNQGEGNKLAAQRYRRAQEMFAQSGKVDKKAREAAKAVDGKEGKELEKARRATAVG